MQTTLPQLLRTAARRYGDRAAYVADGVELSYAELLQRVRRAARGYLWLGLKPGDAVCIWAPNSIDWAVHALAASYAGGVLVPANSRYTAAEVADLVKRSRARIVLVEDGFLDRTQLEDLRGYHLDAEVRDLHAELPAGHPEGPSQGPPAGPDPDPDSAADNVGTDDVADILFTSGTTGTSKGAMSAHRQSIGVARAWAELGGVTEDDRYLVINPFFHSFGYKIGIIVGLLTGCALYPVATFDLDATMELIEREQITLLPGAPTIYQSLLEAPGRAERDLSSLRLAVTGAAVVPVVLIERMRTELAIDKVVTAFGMTEAVVVTMCRDDDSAETLATTCGRAIPGMEIRLGENDELLVRGDYVMLGYLDDRDAGEAAIDEDGWLHTGDVGQIDEAGNLRITDRLKDMYICGGFNVYPAEVEQTLMRMNGISDVAVVGVPDERMGELGKAYVVRSPESTIKADDVIAFARERLANFKAPREVAFVPSLPRNLSGKVLKTELRHGS